MELGGQEGLKIADVEGGALKIVMVEGAGMAVVKVGSPAEDGLPRLAREEKAAAPEQAMNALAELWQQAITGCDLIQQQRMADLFAKVGVEPHWVIKGALRTDPFRKLAAVKVIAELWRVELSSLDEAGRLNAFGSFLQHIWNRDWALLARALEKAQADEAAAKDAKYSRVYRCPKGHCTFVRRPLALQRKCGVQVPESGKEARGDAWVVYADGTPVPLCQETAVLLTKKEKRQQDRESRELLNKTEGADCLEQEFNHGVAITQVRKAKGKAAKTAMRNQARTLAKVKSKRGHA